MRLHCRLRLAFPDLCEQVFHFSIISVFDPLSKREYLPQRQ